MCAPLLPVLAIASAAVTAVGSVASGMQASAQGKYAAQVDERNAKLAADQAADAQDRGREEARKVARQYGQLQGQQTAAMGANGIELGFGSARDVAIDTQLLKGEDLNTVYKNTDRETKGYLIESSNYRAQAQADRAKAKAAMTEGIFGGVSSLLSGASQFGKLQTKYGAAK